MKKFPLLVTVLIVTLLSACNSTPQIAMEKKPLVSDHYLLLSLLNREMTQDQQMMLAFADQRESYKSIYFVNAVEIRGPNDDSNYSSPRPTNGYSKLISQDFNSVQISGPN